MDSMISLMTRRLTPRIRSNKLPKEQPGKKNAFVAPIDNCATRMENNAEIFMAGGMLVLAGSSGSAR